MAHKPARVLPDIALNAAKEFEAFRPFAYPDPASPLAKATRGMKLGWGFKWAPEILDVLPSALRGLDGAPWTIGFGHTRSGTLPITVGRWTEANALLQLDIDMDEAQLYVEKLVKFPINDNQYGALCMLMMNTGPKAWPTSNLLKTINAGELTKVPEILKKWDKARNRDTGKLEPMAGLTRRRIAEALIWSTPVTEAKHKAAAKEEQNLLEQKLLEQDSQRPEPSDSKPLRTSRTMAGSAAAAVGTAGTAASEQLEQIKGLAEPLMEISQVMKWVFIAATFIGIAAIVYARLDQWRKEKG